MFWRSIPRATDVLARPDNDNPPPRAPRPARPPRTGQPALEHEGRVSEDERPPPTSRAGPRPARSYSRPSTFRQAVQEVIDDERARHHPHETMGDVVLAVMRQEDRKGGLARLVARRKSVVGLFRKGDGRVQRDELEGGGALSGRRGQGTSSEDDESDLDDVKPGPPPPSTVSPPRPRPLPPSAALAPRPTPYRSTTLADRYQESSRPTRRPSPVRRSTFVAQARVTPARAGSSARPPPPRRPPSPAYSPSVDPYRHLLERSAYRDVDPDESSEASSTGSSSLSPSSSSARSSLEEGPSFARRSTSASIYTGLVNLGNTCYLSSVLQALVATDALAHFFSSASFSLPVWLHARLLNLTLLLQTTTIGTRSTRRAVSACEEPLPRCVLLVLPSLRP